MNTIKTAVSLPIDVYRKAEAMRKRLGQSRSQMVALALARVVRETELQEIERRDEKAYRERPRSAKDAAAAFRASAEAMEALAREEGDVDWRRYFPTL